MSIILVPKLLTRFNEIMHVKPWRQCMACRKKEMRLRMVAMLVIGLLQASLEHCTRSPSLTSHTAQTVYILLAIKHPRFIILFKNNIPLSLVQKC